MRLGILAVALLVATSASTAHAGRIFGDIKMDGKPVPAGLMVLVTPVPKDKAKVEAAPVDTTVTDKVGSYKVVVKDEGKCKLTLVYEKQPLSLEVFSYKDATRYDLILEKKDDKLTLRRK